MTGGGIRGEGNGVNGRTGSLNDHRVWLGSLERDLRPVHAPYVSAQIFYDIARGETIQDRIRNGGGKAEVIATLSAVSIRESAPRQTSHPRTLLVPVPAGSADSSQEEASRTWPMRLSWLTHPEVHSGVSMTLMQTRMQRWRSYSAKASRKPTLVVVLPQSRLKQIQTWAESAADWRRIRMTE